MARDRQRRIKRLETKFGLSRDAGRGAYEIGPGDHPVTEFSPVARTIAKFEALFTPKEKWQ
jgi:hypothetical protein